MDPTDRPIPPQPLTRPSGRSTRYRSSLADGARADGAWGGRRTGAAGGDGTTACGLRSRLIGLRKPYWPSPTWVRLIEPIFVQYVIIIRCEAYPCQADEIRNLSARILAIISTTYTLKMCR